jgi:hypothetical protein
LALDSSLAHEGAQSLRATVTASLSTGPGEENELNFRFTPQSSGTLAVRSFVRIDSTLGDYAQLIWLAHDPNSGPAYSGYAVTLTHYTGWMLQRFPQGAATDHGASPPAQPALGQWVCVELVITLSSGSGGRAQLYVDGQAVLDVPEATLDSGTPSYGLLSIGIPRAQGDRDETRWFDDVVLAPHPIGCL